MNGDLYLIRGVPGSGKSTFASRLAHALGARHIEADMFMTGGDGRYSFDPSRLSYCHEQCQTFTKSWLAQGLDVVVSNTFTRKWEMRPYLAMGAANVTILRAEGRFANIHGVPVEQVSAMRARMEDA